MYLFIVTRSIRTVYIADIYLSQFSIS